MKTLITFLLLVTTSTGFTQESVLENYIKIALDNNLVMKDKHYSLKQSLTALKEARGMFMPSINFQTRYTFANGGRAIAIPTGDIVNPVYSSLNQIMESVGQQGGFPTDLANEEIKFIRTREQETKLELTQPLFEPAIYYSYKIKQEMIGMSEDEIRLYQKELTAEVKTAYYNHSKAIELQKLMNKIMVLLEENLRVNEKLVETNKLTNEAVFRAQADISEHRTQIAVAHKNVKMTQAYFNFLLNQPLDEPITLEESSAAPQSYDLEFLRSQALAHRDELAKLEKGLGINSYQIKMANANYLPGIFFSANYGFQGEEYRFDSKSDFTMASFVMKWNLFNGFQRSAQKESAKLQQQQLSTQQEQLEQQIKFQVWEAHYQLQQDQKKLESTAAQLREASRTYNIIEKKFKEGVASQIELIDARTQYTNAAAMKIISDYNYLIALANVARVIGK